MKFGWNQNYNRHLILTTLLESLAWFKNSAFKDNFEIEGFTRPCEILSVPEFLTWTLVGWWHGQSEKLHQKLLTNGRFWRLPGWFWQANIHSAMEISAVYDVEKKFHQTILNKFVPEILTFSTWRILTDYWIEALNWSQFEGYHGKLEILLSHFQLTHLQTFGLVTVVAFHCEAKFLKFRLFFQSSFQLNVLW